jgi:hypothetical protein
MEKEMVLFKKLFNRIITMKSIGILSTILFCMCIISCKTTTGVTDGPVDSSLIIMDGEGISAVYFKDTGLAFERALELAFKDAVAKACGQVLHSEAKTYNMQFISEEISAKTTGLIKTHKILSKGLRDNGASFYVKIKAYIYPTQIKNRLEHILAELGNPKMMFLIKETIYIKERKNKIRKINYGAGSTFSEISIGEYLTEKGCKFVDKNVVEEIAKKNQRVINKALKGNASAALQLATNLSDVVIIGNAETRDAGELSSMGIDGAEGMVSAQATIKYKVIDVYTGNLIAQESAQTAQVHVQKVTAAQLALQKAAKKTLDSLIGKIRKYYIDKPRQNEILLNLVGTDINSQELLALKSLILTTTRSKKITAVKAKGKTIQWRVIYPGTAEGLMEEITLKQKKMGFTLKLLEYNLGTINYKVSKI